MSHAARILVVDDDGATRQALCRTLSEASMSFDAVPSGAEALQFLGRCVPSLVLLDLVMPPPDGFHILRFIRGRRETAKVPVVVLTSLDDPLTVAQAFSSGADDVVRKPISSPELVARIRGQLSIGAHVDALAKREHDAQMVLELTQTLCSNLDFRDILFTVVRRIAEVARVDRCSIVLVRDEGDVGYVVAASDDQTLRDLPIDLTKYPEIRTALSGGNPLIIKDASTHPLFDVVRNDIPPSTFSSLALLPILFEGRAMGVLFLRSRQHVQFDPQELALYRTIANTTAIALRNARVLQSLRDQTQQITFARFEAERRLVTLQRYADFFESSADGIVVMDHDGRILFSNPRARHVMGYSGGDLEGHTLSEFLPPDEVARESEIRAGFHAGVHPEAVDLRLLRRDGRELVVSVNFSSVLREENAILLTFRDVTQERALEKELLRTKEFLERVIDSSLDAIVAADMQGRVVLFNRAAERCYGYQAAEVMGKLNVARLYPEGVAKEVMRLIRSVEFGGQAKLEDYRCDVLGRTGERVPVSLSAALIFNEGKAIASVGLFTDLRERLQMEERLAAAQGELEVREKQMMIAELAGAAAHELNQPLTSVMGYAELLKRKLDRETPAHSAAEVIVNEAERMAEIVRKIGKITRYETKTYVGAAKILDLDKASQEPSATARKPGDP